MSARQQEGGLNRFFVAFPQVLAVNILGRFLLNNDRNIRSVPPSLPSDLAVLAFLKEEDKASAGCGSCLSTFSGAVPEGHRLLKWIDPLFWLCLFSIRRH